MIIAEKNLEKEFMKLALQKAYENLGSTSINPSVGCVIVKKGCVISSGKTSISGRPHAEFNALNKNENFNGSTMYVTLEPCVHFGKTPPCSNKILRKKLKKVYYPILDVDERTRGKTKKILNKNKIKVRIGILNNEALDFYKSYFLSRRKSALPFVDAKIAISKDFYSVNKKKKWITNEQSRSKVHLIRSRYDCILSTYKSVNKDNSKLDCRIKGLEHLSPARVIIDRNHKLKKKLDLFKSSKKIKTYVVIGKKNTFKENFLKKKNIKIIKMYNNNKYLPYEKILLKLKRMGFTRILCESGFKTTNSLIKKKLIYNLYVFNSSYQLGRYGYNSYKYLLNKLKFKKKEKININLFGDELHKFKIK